MDAFKGKDSKKAVEYGLMVLKDFPDRLPVLLNLSTIFDEAKDIDKCIYYFNLALAAKDKDPSFWEDNKAYIGRHCVRLAKYERNNNRFLSAYNLLSESHSIDSSGISKEKLYDIGMELVKENTSKGQYAQAYGILKRMEPDFQNHWPIFIAIAWQILSHPNSVLEKPEVAKNYAEKAVRLLEKENSPYKDIAYNTLAEAYYHLKNYKEMRQYEDKTMEVAPDKRKKNYKPRTVLSENIE
jgi:tetratricopeptide (TPR) repeat protein